MYKRQIPLYGAAVIGCRECTLDLHGKPTVRAWTYLAATAAAGDTELVLEEPVHDWAPDGAAPVMVMVTSTAANGTMEEAETCVLLGVDGTGTRLTLSAPLLYDHLGQTFPLDGGHAVTFRANVALLSRNVVVQGSQPMASLDKHGGHIMLHSRRHGAIADRSQGESLVGRIEDIEVRYAGQAFRLGRYPIHFHMIGTVRKSYIRRVSIHHTFNRAVAIHGVHYLRVQDNVAFETMGHTYFIEDGVETKNIITGNLGANTRESFALLTVDATPATYWITNPDNYVVNNVAAGSTHYGFWFFPEPKVRGASEAEGKGICPQGVPLLKWADNEAHNNGKYGLRIFTNNPDQVPTAASGFYPRRKPCEDVVTSKVLINERLSSICPVCKSCGTIKCMRIMDQMPPSAPGRGCW